MKLAIVSHTEHFKDSTGQIVGWGPTIREINFLASHFDEIYHIAPLYDNELIAGSLPYESPNVTFIPLRPSGGHSLKGKLSVLAASVHNTRIVKQYLKQVDVFQFRAPTGMGVYLIPWLYWFSGKKGWFKYAGNWDQQNPPLGYAFQRWMLKRFKRTTVTINGNWPNQPAHCLGFENPCLDADERKLGLNLLAGKDYNGVLDFCFIGRLESAKGVGRIIDAFVALGPMARIGKIHFVGDGPERDKFEKMAAPIADKCVFHGFVKRAEVANILAACHVFLLPSDSEGFPKVVAEAANYGCIPVVSNVSCIGQYVVGNQSGYLLPENGCNATNLEALVRELLQNKQLDKMAHEAYLFAEKFTFENYTNRIFNEILHQPIH